MYGILIWLIRSQIGPPDRVRVDQFGDPIPKGALWRAGTVRFRHWDSIHCVSTSSCGRTIASGGNDGFVRVWQADGKQRAAFTFDHVDCSCISPSGKLLGVFDGKKLWVCEWERARKFTLLAEIWVQGEGVRPRLLFSADDQYLAFVDPAGTSWLWKLPDVRLLKMSGIFLGQDYPIAAFSRN